LRQAEPAETAAAADLQEHYSRFRDRWQWKLGQA